MSSPADGGVSAGGFWPPVRVSATGARTNNPIRATVDRLGRVAARGVPGKPLIPLSLGDPSVFGNFPPPAVLVDAVVAAARGGAANGYAPASGPVPARRAVARVMSVPGRAPLTEDDVVIASGCSGALDLAITALLGEGDALVVPAPAFALYATLAVSKGVAVVPYALDPAAGWAADLPALRAALAAATAGGRAAALLVNNPSNPCGSVYTAAHLADILAAADDARVPVIADEIYAGLVFGGGAGGAGAAGGSADAGGGGGGGGGAHAGAAAPAAAATAGCADVFTPLAQLSERVPILACGGIAKEFLVPGWRVGWVAVHDRGGAAEGVRRALFALANLVIGANTLVLAALPALLTPEAGSPAAAALARHKAETLAQLRHNADYCVARLRTVPGVAVVRPAGAMYVMFSWAPGALAPAAPDAGGDDVAFAEALLAEEAVFVLPGSCFGMPGWARIVTTVPAKKLGEAFDRLEAFVVRHAAAGPAAASAALAAARAAAGGDEALRAVEWVAPPSL